MCDGELARCGGVVLVGVVMVRVYVSAVRNGSVACNHEVGVGRSLVVGVCSVCRRA